LLRGARRDIVVDGGAIPRITFRGGFPAEFWTGLIRVVTMKVAVLTPMPRAINGKKRRLSAAARIKCCMLA
jgi:hypothetical protein